MLYHFRVHQKVLGAVSNVFPEAYRIRTIIAKTVEARIT